MAAVFREGFVEADGFRIRYMEAGGGAGVPSAGASRLTKIGPPFRAAEPRRSARGSAGRPFVVGGSGKMQCFPLA